MNRPKTKVGFKEKVTFVGIKKEKTVLARIDTGAKRCSIDRNLAEEIGIGKVIKLKKVKSALGETDRPIVKLLIKIAGRKIRAFCGISDRAKLKYPALIGRNVLKRGFVVEETEK
jgi:hypothetical protein